MNQEKIDAMLALLKEANQRVNYMAESSRCLAIAIKRAHELDVIGLQAVLQQKDPDPKPSDPEAGEKKEQK